MKAIMVPVADRPECATALGATFDLAHRLSGNVIGYHVRPHRNEKRTKTPRKSQVPLRRYEWDPPKSQRQIDLDVKSAHTLFTNLAEKYGFVTARKARYLEEGGLAVWHDVTGDPEHIFSIIGPLSDMIVVSRPSSQRSVKARAFAHAALTRSGRPVLYLPDRKLSTVGTRVLVAWNQSEQSAASVMSSLPLLIHADSVSVVAALRDRHLGPGVKHLQHYLKLHGVNSDVITTPGRSANEEIVQAYHDTDSDLLLMGAYSRPKWREQIFGGVTQHIIEKTKLPTLMLHTNN